MFPKLEFNNWMVSKCIYGSITFFLYILTIIMIVRHRSIFNGSFFTLYSVMFFYNIVAFAFSFFVIRFPDDDSCFFTDSCSLNSSFFENEQSDSEYITSYPMTIYFFVQLTITCIQYSGVLLTCYNRYTAIIDVHGYNNDWNEFLPVTMFMVTMFSFVFAVNLLIYKPYYEYSHSLGYYLMLTDKSFVKSAVFFYKGTHTAGSMYVNTKTIKKVFELKVFRQLYENRFLDMSLILSIIQLVVFIGDTIPDYNRYVPSWLSNLCITILPILPDLMTFSPPWLLLATNKHTRKQMVKMYCPFKSAEPAARIFEIVHHSQTIEQRQQQRTSYLNSSPV